MPTARVAQLGHHPLGGLGQRAGQRRAVGVAQGHVLGAGLRRRAQAAQRVAGDRRGRRRRSARRRRSPACPRPRRKATESAIIARFSSGSTRVTFSRCSDQVLPTSVQTGGEAVGQHPQRRVVRRRDVAAAGHAEGGDLGVVEASRRASSSNSASSLGLELGKPASIEVDAERRRARAPRAPSRRRTGTCPRPACRRGGWCRRGGPGRPWG